MDFNAASPKQTEHLPCVIKPMLTSEIRLSFATSKTYIFFAISHWNCVHSWLISKWYMHIALPTWNWPIHEADMSGIIWCTLKSNSPIHDYLNSTQASTGGHDQQGVFTLVLSGRGFEEVITISAGFSPGYKLVELAKYLSRNPMVGEVWIINTAQLPTKIIIKDASKLY